MMLEFYVDRDTAIHRAGAGLKLLLLAGLGAGLFFLKTWPPLVMALAGAVGLTALARIPFGALLRQLRPLLLLVAVVFASQLYFYDAAAALVATLRLLTLLLLSILVTLTTRPSEIVAAIERALQPLDGWIAVEKVSLAISLALRFIPVLARMAAETREAQWARGRDRSMVALLTPLIIQTLKMADQVAEALDARGFGAAEKEERGACPSESRKTRPDGS